ncbi:hypothetical protein F0562_003393 [Nyssa sinensis]|uniref:FAD-binding domain-containing protein n=1 Tax=Nyssa sinensis TaxID=561372 RepID=A0A5J5BWC9_9ASTE|nr:hypothetical protein F0562_003393 [Nyssa sinensis]
MEMVEDVVVVGAGIAGLAVAVALKRVGIGALVLERSEELRATGAALTLFPNAWVALAALGVAHKLTSVYAPCTRGFMTNVSSGVIQDVSMTGKASAAAPRSVHRKALLEALAEELPINTIRFSSKLTSVEAHKQDDGSSISIIHLKDGTVVKAKVLIGCDGVHSVVARWLGLRAPVNSGRSAMRGLAVFPEGHGLQHEIQQFVDVGKRGGFVPLTDKELYWFLVCKSTSKGQDMGGKPELIRREVTGNVAKDFPPIYLDVVGHSDPSTLTWSPLLFRLPWDVIFGNACKGTITVAGDALHPMTPDLGQGGCAALEDAVILGRHIGESFIRFGRLVPQETAKAIESYVKERRWRVSLLIAASYLSGWMQQDGSGWLMKFFRELIFNRLLYSRIIDAVRYDCGKLPTVSSSGELKKQD